MSTALKGKCDVCNSPAEKRCSKCKLNFYCGRDHQTQAWPLHKKTCGKNPNTTPKDVGEGGKTMLGKFLKTSAGAGDNEPLDHFAELTKEEAYIRLIDAYRLRVEDDYAFGGDTHGLYNQDPPLPDFKRFLRLAAKKKTLPPWWNPSVDVAAITKVANTDSWACIHFAVEKSDIVEHYNDPTAPMVLRFLAEQVYGTNASAW